MGRHRFKRIQRKSTRDQHVQRQSRQSPATEHPLQSLQRSVGSQAVQRLINSPYIQTKLQVSSPEDQLEGEADRTAGAVMRSPASGELISGAPSHSNSTNESEKGHDQGSFPVSRNLESKLESSGNPKPLPGNVRDFMESRLDADLSGVRVHTDSDASQMNEQLQAQAFTRGQDVYYGAGKSPRNDALTAHELTHVVQQTGRVPLSQNSAARAGSEVALARSGPSISTSLISRTPDDDEKKKLEEKAAALAIEMQKLIDRAVWKEIRKDVYPKESAAGIKRAKERKTGARPDLTGLGKISTLERFAGAIKAVQSGWGPMAVDDRVTAIGAAANTELTAAGVPPFRSVAKATTPWKGFFQAGLWKFSISEALVNGATLSDADAAELANTTLHEARHAEQNFLSARYSAGPPDNKSAVDIGAEQHIPIQIATAAVAAKFNAATDPTVAALGKEMYKAHVTEGVANQKISDDDYTKEMETARDAAVISLAALKASATAATIADSTAKREKLKLAIAEVWRRYTFYRNIPYEADAHEVGDAAEQAFKGWP